MIWDISSQSFERSCLTDTPPLCFETGSCCLKLVSDPPSLVSCLLECAGLSHCVWLGIVHSYTVTMISWCLLFQIQKKRGDLRLIVASATLDAEVRASLFSLFSVTGELSDILRNRPPAKACHWQSDLPLWGPSGALDATRYSFSLWVEISLLLTKRADDYPLALSLSLLSSSWHRQFFFSYFSVWGYISWIYLWKLHTYFNVFGAIEVFPVM